MKHISGEDHGYYNGRNHSGSTCVEATRSILLISYLMPCFNTFFYTKLVYTIAGSFCLSCLHCSDRIKCHCVALLASIFIILSCYRKTIWMILVLSSQLYPFQSLGILNMNSRIIRCLPKMFAASIIWVAIYSLLRIYLVMLWMIMRMRSDFPLLGYSATSVTCLMSMTQTTAPCRPPPQTPPLIRCTMGTGPRGAPIDHTATPAKVSHRTTEYIGSLGMLCLNSLKYVLKWIFLCIMYICFICLYFSFTAISFCSFWPQNWRLWIWSCK